MTSGIGSGIENGLNRHENHERDRQALHGAIDATAEAGFPNVICFSGNREGHDGRRGLKNCAEGLKQVVGLRGGEEGHHLHGAAQQQGQPRGLHVRPHALGRRAVQGASARERFKLLYDIYHMQIMEGDVIRTIQENHALLRPLPHRRQPRPQRDRRDAGAELPGDLKAIVDTGFKGYVAQEFIPKRGPLASLAAGVQDLRRVRVGSGKNRVAGYMPVQPPGILSIGSARLALGVGRQRLLHRSGPACRTLAAGPGAAPFLLPVAVSRPPPPGERAGPWPVANWPATRQFFSRHPQFLGCRLEAFSGARGRQ